MTAELTGAAAIAPDRATLAAVRAIAVDHVAFVRGEMVVPEELLVGVETVRSFGWAESVCGADE